MLSLFIKKTVKSWAESNIINDADIDIYEYGLELILSSVINITIIVITGIYAGRLMESIALLLVVIPLQSCGGGYHAKTHMCCFLIMYLGWWGVMWLIPYMNLISAIFIACISLITIFTLAPVVHKNVPMSDQQVDKMKILVRKLSIVAATIGIIISCYGGAKKQIGYSFVMGVGVVMISMIAASIKRK